MANNPDMQTTGNEDPRQHPDFEKVFVGYLDELNLNGFVDPDQILQDHPEIAPAILEDLEDFIQLRSEENSGLSLGTLGDFTLRCQIGRGGMGVVYDAWQNSLDRRAALKVLPGGLLADLKAVARFEREAKIAGRLQHPNIVSVHGLSVDDNTPHYAMDYVEGETLAKILTRLRAAEGKKEDKKTELQSISKLLGKSEKAEKAEDGEEDKIRRPESPLETDDFDTQYYARVATAFAGAASGLQHAHSKGVIHRDIKSSNLILDSEGCLRILDFGLARLEGLEGFTATGDFVGTPLYMSPEQARQRKAKIDHRTDVYSLGATMYEMLTLLPPFKGKDHFDTLSQIIEKTPTELRKLNPRIPRDLETIVLKCIRKEPRDRYSTAEALAEDLMRFVRSEPIEARPRSSIEKTADLFRQKPWAVVACTACLLLLIVLLVTMLKAPGPTERVWMLQKLDSSGIGIVQGLDKNGKPTFTWPMKSLRFSTTFSVQNENQKSKLVALGFEDTVKYREGCIKIYDPQRSSNAEKAFLDSAVVVPDRLMPDPKPKKQWAVDGLSRVERLTGDDLLVQAYNTGHSFKALVRFRHESGQLERQGTYFHNGVVYFSDPVRLGGKDTVFFFNVRNVELPEGMPGQYLHVAGLIDPARLEEKKEWQDRLGGAIIDGRPLPTGLETVYVFFAPIPGLRIQMRGRKITRLASTEKSITVDVSWRRYGLLPNGTVESQLMVDMPPRFGPSLQRLIPDFMGGLENQVVRVPVFKEKTKEQFKVWLQTWYDKEYLPAIEKWAKLVEAEIKAGRMGEVFLDQYRRDIQGIRAKP